MTILPAVVDDHGHTSLPWLISRAAEALAGATTAAEVLDARDRATLAYDAAKRAARIQKAKRAHDDIIAATHRAQADALDIEAAAKRRLADEYDAAQERGEVAKGSVRTDIVPVQNDVRPATAAEIGLDRKDIHDARQVRDAIAANPAVVREALDDILANGDAPTRAALKRAIQPRANLRAAVGTDSATKAERGNNLYETPIEAMRTLLALESFSPVIWEPACGKGAIVRPLEDAGYEVIPTDLVDYGTATKDGEVQEVGSFLETSSTEDGIRGAWRGAIVAPGPGLDHLPLDIVTNPPYGSDLNRFVAHALRVHRPRKMALLLNLNFLCGFEDPDRCFAMDENPPARILVFTRRLPMMHRDGWDGNIAASRMNTAWFMWEQDADGRYAGPTTVRRVDWKDFENRAPLAPCASMPAASEPATVRAPGLIWDQPYENGRIVAMLGSVEVGAVFPDRDDPKKTTWAYWLGLATFTGQKKAKSVEAAKAALLKKFRDATGLEAAE